MTTRRAFLKSSGLAMFGVGAAPLWLQRAAGASPSRKKILVVIFQRGAMDGLSAVVPYGEKRYYDLRPSVAIARPGQPGATDRAIDLDGFFGLHPSLEPLKPIYDAGELAVVHAAGSPDPTRSHFDAQDYMESGTPGRKATTDGWLNRSLPAAPEVSPVRAVSLGQALPRSLRGKNEAVAINNMAQFRVRDAAFEDMYKAAADSLLSSAGRETFAATRLVESIQKQPYAPAHGAEYPANKLGQSLEQIARLIKAGVGLEVAFADMGGWDTHSNQSPQLTNLLGQFAGALAAFHRDMGDQMQDIAVVTMSEFGRTAKENGSRGTDHGHANVMFAFGGGIRGGKVYGRWPGLEPENLYEQRDLAITTDFRDVLGELVAGHLGNPAIGKVFPEYQPSRFPGLLA